MKLIDTHCHLESTEFDLDRDIVVERARAKQIDIISSAVTSDSWQKNIDICQKYNNVFPALGLNPIDCQNIDGLLLFLKKYHSNLVAIGECGLDYYFERNHAAREKQAMSFLESIRIAEELKLPIQVHSRSAGKAAITLLEKADARLVHMHAFDAKASVARMASRELGYFFSIPTSVVRSPQKQKLVRAVHIEKLLVETDSPVLGVEGGTRNEPSNLPIALREVASILNRNEDEICQIILENTLRLYSRIKIK
ncbi:MAG: TatD family hydrolase [Candidatus Thorarchaeota archaeon]